MTKLKTILAFVALLSLGIAGTTSANAAPKSKPTDPAMFEFSAIDVVQKEWKLYCGTVTDAKIDRANSRIWEELADTMGLSIEKRQFLEVPKNASPHSPMYHAAEAIKNNNANEYCKLTLQDFCKRHGYASNQLVGVYSFRLHAGDDIHLWASKFYCKQPN